MYVAPVRQRDPVRARPDRIPLPLARIAHRVFGEGGPFGWDDHVYFPDLMRSYGVACRPEQFAGRRNSFMDMTSAMVPRLHPYADRFDVAVLTGVTPDSQPGFPMCHLSNHVPGAGLSFAVFDHGVVGPFAALHTLASCVWADGASRAVLLVVDQSTVLHDEPVPERLRARQDSAVGLVLDPAGELGTVHVPRSVPAAERELPDLLAAVRAGAGPVRAVLGGLGLRAHLPDPPPELRWSAAGLPATGIWAALAAGLPGWRDRGGRVLLADYEPDQQRLATCLVDLAPGRPG